MSDTTKDPLDGTCDAFCLDGLQKVLDQNMRSLFQTEVQWLFAEAHRLHRANRAADARMAQMEAELKVKDREYTCMVSEWNDLADENRMLKQQGEVDRFLLDSQERTVADLRRQLEAATAMSGVG